MSAGLFAAGSLIAVSAWICTQDFKERKVYLFCYPLLAMCVLAVQYTHCGFGELFLENLIINNCILFIQFAIITVYFKWVRSVQPAKVIGVGDILFYFCLTPLMSVPTFVMFNIASLLVVIVLFIFLRKQLKLLKDSIPLAGIQAACLIVVQLLDCYYTGILGTCQIPQWMM
jgi:hypothetical protein